MRHLLAFPALAALAALALPATSQAATQTDLFIDSYSPVPGAWHGHLEAEGKERCLDKRKVTLFRKKNGKKIEVGSVKSMYWPNVGTWDLDDPSAKNGKYVATVPAKTGCTAAKSAVFRYPADNTRR